MLAEGYYLSGLRPEADSSRGFLACPVKNCNDLRNLVQLVLAHGPKTDAAAFGGTEYPVLQPLVREYFNKDWYTEVLYEHAAAYECQGVAFTNGWTRGLSFVLAGYFLISRELVDTYRQHCPSQFSRFCHLRGTVTQEFGSELDRIKISEASCPYLRSS